MWITNEETGVSVYIIDHFSLIRPETSITKEGEEKVSKLMKEFTSKLNEFYNKEKATV